MMSRTILLVVVLAALIATVALGVTPDNSTILLIEPMLWDAQSPDVSLLFSDNPYGMLVWWDLGPLDDSCPAISALEYYLSDSYGIVQYSARHFYGSTGILVQGWLTSSMRNTVLANHPGYAPYDGPGWYGIVAPPAVTNAAFSSGNTIVNLDVCNSKGYIESGFQGYGAGMGYIGEMDSDIAAQNLTNFWTKFNQGNTTIQQALNDYMFPISYDMATGSNLSLMLFEGSVGNEDGQEPGEELPSDVSSRRGITSFPNPFNPAVRIDLESPRPGNVELRIFDAKGRLVWKDLVAVEGGAASTFWNGRSSDGRSLPSGQYFVQGDIAGVVVGHKLTLLR